MPRWPHPPLPSNADNGIRNASRIIRLEADGSTERVDRRLELADVVRGHAQIVALPTVGLKPNSVAESIHGLLDMPGLQTKPRSLRASA